MAKSKIISTFEFNLYRLKKHVNNNYIGDFKSKILLQTFNGIIKNYPDSSWQQIADSFFLKLPQYDMELIIIYTILSYKIGINFTNCNSEFIHDLISSFCYYNINPTKIVKYANLFCSCPLYEIITDAQINHLIKPRHLFKIAMDNYNLDCLTKKDEQDLVKRIKRFIEESYKPIFDGNYSFFNVYLSLKKLISLEYYEIDTFALDVIPLLNSIPSDKTQNEIKMHFANIDNSPLSIIDKIEECLNVAYIYGYEIPINEKSLK